MSIKQAWKNSVDHDQMPRIAASDQSLHCFLRLVWTNAYGKYGKV